MGELIIVGKKSIVLSGETIEGELKLTWETENAGEVALAEKAFKEYVSRGWLAIGEKEGKMIQIFSFDPTFEKILLGPIAVGG